MIGLLSDQTGAAHSVKQRKAVYRGGAAVNGAHGACGADGDDLRLFARGVGVNRIDGRGTIAFLGTFWPCPAFEHAAAGHFFKLFAAESVIEALGMHEAPSIKFLVTQLIDDVAFNAVIVLQQMNADAVFKNGLHHLSSFMTRRVDYSCGRNCAYKPAQINLSSGLLHSVRICAESDAIAPCQYTKYARSGGVADAVREHSFDASFVFKNTLAIAALARGDAERLSLVFLCMLTPARFDASSLAGQIFGHHGFGVLVPRFRSENHRWNRQAIEIIKHSSPVLRFRVCASRHAYACAHVGPCACICARNAGTLEPYQYIYNYQLDIGSIVGSDAGTLEPALTVDGQAHGFLPISNKLEGGYARAGVDLVLQGLGARGRRGKVWAFSVARSVGGAIGGRSVLDLGSCGELGAASLGALLWAGRSDGFLRVSEGRLGHVGMLLLEYEGQAVDMLCNSALRPLPIGKATRSGGARALTPTSHPPLPPFAIAPPSSSMARCRGQILERLRPDNHIGTMRCRQMETRRNGWRNYGSGREISVRINPTSAGQGCKEAGWQRRFCQATGSVAHVN